MVWCHVNLGERGGKIKILIIINSHHRQMATLGLSAISESEMGGKKSVKYKHVLDRWHGKKAPGFVKR